MKYLVKDCVSKYQILVNKENKNAVFAMQILQRYIKEAAGVEIKEAKTKDDSKLIIIGFDSINLDKGRVVSKVIDDNLYLDGDGKHGSTNAVIEFLRQTINFDCVDGCCYFDKTKNIKLLSFDIKPSFKYRFATYGWIRNDENVRTLMRLDVPKDILITGDIYHNAIEVLKYNNTKIKDDYLNKEKNQICYSNNEVKKIFVKNLKSIIKDKKIDSQEYFMLGIEDNIDWCNCKNCKNKNQSDTMVKFINDVVESVNTELNKPIKFLVFAYYNTLRASAIKLNKNVGVFYAPIKARFRKPLNDKDNLNYLNNLKEWSKQTDTLFAWTYSFYTRRNFVFYDTFSSIQKNYRLLEKNRVIGLYDQTVSYALEETGFAHLKAYIQSHLLWNNKENVDKLIKKYFLISYEQYSKKMYEIFESTRKQFSELYKLENIDPKTNVSEENLDKYSEIGQCIDRFDCLKDSINSNKFKIYLVSVISDMNEMISVSNEELAKKIKLEQISYRYLYLLIFDRENKDEFLQLFKDLKKFNILYVQEGKKVETIADIKL